jgi:uncharacterized membrane protein
MWDELKEIFRKNFLAGLLVLIPVVVTVYIFIGVGKLLAFFPFFENEFVNAVLNIIFTVVIILVVGTLARNYIGKKIVALGESIVVKIPIVKNIYMALKQLVNTIFMRNSRSFREVVLVEYPRRGIYSIAFVTGETVGELKEKVEARETKEAVNIFVPTTPNPTSGFYLVVPLTEIIPLDLTVEEAFKIVFSAGVLSERGANELANKGSRPK